MASYQALQKNLYQSSVKLYQGLPSNSCDPYSCLWPFTNAMAGTEFLSGEPGASSYAAAVRGRLQGLLAYADLNETSPSGASQPRAFELAVAPPEGPGWNTYYDDNAWLVLDLLDGYQLTGNPTDLRRLRGPSNSTASGWDTSNTDGCPVGVFWEDVSGSQRNTVANAGGAEVGLELNELTNDSIGPVLGDPDVPMGEHLSRSTRRPVLRPRQSWWKLEHHDLELQPGHDDRRGRAP